MFLTLNACLPRAEITAFSGPLPSSLLGAASCRRSSKAKIQKLLPICPSRYLTYFLAKDLFNY